MGLSKENEKLEKQYIDMAEANAHKTHKKFDRKQFTEQVNQHVAKISDLGDGEVKAYFEARIEVEKQALLPDPTLADQRHAKQTAIAVVLEAVLPPVKDGSRIGEGGEMKHSALAVAGATLAQDKSIGARAGAAVAGKFLAPGTRPTTEEVPRAPVQTSTPIYYPDPTPAPTQVIAPNQTNAPTLAQFNNPHATELPKDGLGFVGFEDLSASAQENLKKTVYQFQNTGSTVGADHGFKGAPAGASQRSADTTKGVH